MADLNSREDLRPIGTEFEQVFEPNERSTNTRFAIFRYRISGHALCAKANYEGAPTYWAETLETLDVRYEAARVTYDFGTGKTTYERVDPE